MQSSSYIEALAIFYAVKKNSYFLKGCARFTVVTNHKPLIGIWRKDVLDVDNIQLARIMERLPGYNFKVTWVTGRLHHNADELCKAPIFRPTKEDGEEDINYHVCYNATVTTGPNKETTHTSREDPHIAPLFKAAANRTYKAIVEAIKNKVTKHKL